MKVPPKRIKAISARYMALDRKYFQDHPGENEYTRPFVPGESWPARFHPVPDLTLVIKVTEDFRLRQFLYVKPTENQGAARWVRCEIDGEGADGTDHSH